MAKNASVAVILSQSVEGRKGLDDMTVKQALAYVADRFTNEDGEASMTEGEMLGFLAVYGARRMMALSKDGERVTAKVAPTHVYLPRAVDGAAKPKVLAGMIDVAREEFRKALIGGKAPAPAPVKAPKAAPVKGEKKARTQAQIDATARMLAAKPSVKSSKGEARAAKVAAKAIAKGASAPVKRPDLTPETITQPNPAPATKSVTLANGSTFTVEDNSGL
jgi:hypothetical protein